MKIRPGRRLVTFAGWLAALSSLAFLWPAAGWLLVPVFPALVVAAVLDWRVLRRQRDSLTVTRVMPSAVGRDCLFRVELRLTNGAGHRAAGELRDQAPAGALPSLQIMPFAIEAEGTRRIESEFRIPTRGSYEFGPVWVRVQGSFGFLEAQWSLPSTGRVKVLPEGFAASEGLTRDEKAELLLLDKDSRSRRQGPGTEFAMLSEYRPGDDPRRIDWRTTARYRRPVVRRFQIEQHRDVMIVIDCGRLMGADAGRGTKLDCAVDSALMLARTALEQGDRCGIALFDDQVLGYLPPVSGIGSLRRLSESMYNIESRWRESDFGPIFATLQARQSKRSLVVVLSDVVDVETTARYRASVARLSRRHVVLLAALQTPLLRQIVQAPVKTLVDGSKKAVTFRLLRQREQALHSLRRGNTHVLDVEPSRLTVPLINRFVELRGENLL